MDCHFLKFLKDASLSTSFFQATDNLQIIYLLSDLIHVELHERLIREMFFHESFVLNPEIFI